MLWVNLIVVGIALWSDLLVWRKRIVPSRMGRRGRVALLLFWSVPLLWTLGSYAIEKFSASNPISWSRLSAQIELLFLLVVPALSLLHAALITRHRALHLGSIAIALVGIATLLGGYLVGSRKLRIERVELHSPRLPEGFDSLRIVHLSDLHVGVLHDPIGDCRHIVEQSLALQPDIILFTGDLIHIRYTELTPEVMAELSRLKAPLGVWSVVGNHDTGVYIRDSLQLPHTENLQRLVARQQEMGWQVLDNESRTLHRHGDSITLSGIAFPASLRNFRHKRQMPDDYHFEQAFEGADPALYNLTLCHLPQLFDPVTELGYGDLMLSGHVHSMQHKLPIGRRGWSLSRLKYRRWSGLYREDERALYINDGIGSVGIPVRIGTRPEVTLITLRREE